MAGLLRYLPVALPPFSPHYKGKIERFHRTLVEQFLSQEPFFTGGPKTGVRKAVLARGPRPARR